MEDWKKFKRQWLHQYGHFSSTWKHTPIRNGKILFETVRTSFAFFLGVGQKFFHENAWILDYAVSLQKCLDAGFIGKEEAEKGFGYLTSPYYHNYLKTGTTPPYKLFFTSPHIQHMFKVMAQEISFSDKVKKIASYNRKRWLMDYNYSDHVAKHRFLNTQTLFKTEQEYFSGAYPHEGEILYKNLWILDYLLSLDRAVAQQLIGEDRVNFLKELLLSDKDGDIKFGVSLLKEKRLWTIMKRVAEK